MVTLVEPSPLAGPARAAMGGRARAARWLADPWPEHAAVVLLHSDEPVTSIGRAVG